MSRRNKTKKRELLPDPRYKNVLITQFSNYLMEDGKRTVANAILYEAIEGIPGDKKIESFIEIVDKVKPSLEVRARRVGGATYQVPTEVSATRRIALAIRWIIASAKKRGEKTMATRLLGEFKDILAGNGNSLKKRMDVHKMAEANKAFAHFRW
ncbi:MAG: 30S ribosomal protein S7 [Alphaproteobacteria bacterium]|nr:30S ribosomal protein S7 [Alphaproteobacteria bacterium]